MKTLTLDIGSKPVTEYIHGSTSNRLDIFSVSLLLRRKRGVQHRGATAEEEGLQPTEVNSTLAEF